LRAYTRECLLGLPFLSFSDDFVFDSQMLADAVTSGMRVVEVPIPTRYTEESSSIGIGRSLRYMGGSLAWCARRALQRGRRGSHYPLTARGARKHRRARGTASPEALASATRSMLEGYWSSTGDRAAATIVTEGLAGLERARVTPEGLLALWDAAGTDPIGVRAVLEAAGFRPIEWRSEGGTAIVLARESGEHYER
jgi:hypothetical protein